jgi:hypothetical protein
MDSAVITSVHHPLLISFLLSVCLVSAELFDELSSLC